MLAAVGNCTTLAHFIYTLCHEYDRAKEKKDKKPVKETVTRVFTINLHKRIHGVYVASLFDVVPFVSVLLSHFFD